MKLCLLVLTLICAGSISAQQQVFDFDRFQRLLEVDKKKIREDQFAACEAIAKRYEITVRVRLEKQISLLDLYCDLTQKQSRRLDLATLGAARTIGNRFQHDVEATRAEADHAVALKTLIGLRTEMRGLMLKPEQSTFWKKAVASTLTTAQQQALEKETAARLVFRKRAWVINAVDTIDAEVLLTVDQRQRLQRVLEIWIEQNNIPAMQRGRRGAWKVLPENVVADLVFPEVGGKRKKILIGISPHHMRDQLIKPAATEGKPAN